MESLLRSSIIAGIPTELCIQQYADRILVLVSQIDKVGNMIQASLPSKIPLPPRPEPNPDTPTQIPLPDPSPAIEITPLLSSAPSEDIQTLHNLYAAQIATLIWTAEAENHVDVRRPLVLGIALRKSNSSGHELNPEIFGGIMKMVSEVLWGEPTLSKP